MNRRIRVVLAQQRPRSRRRKWVMACLRSVTSFCASLCVSETFDFGLNFQHHIQGKLLFYRLPLLITRESLPSRTTSVTWRLTSKAWQNSPSLSLYLSLSNNFLPFFYFFSCKMRTRSGLREKEASCENKWGSWFFFSWYFLEVHSTECCFFLVEEMNRNLLEVIDINW